MQPCTSHCIMLRKRTWPQWASTGHVFEHPLATAWFRNGKQIKRANDTYTIKLIQNIYAMATARQRLLAAFYCLSPAGSDRISCRQHLGLDRADWHGDPNLEGQCGYITRKSSCSPQFMWLELFSTLEPVVIKVSAQACGACRVPVAS